MNSRLLMTMQVSVVGVQKIGAVPGTGEIRADGPVPSCEWQAFDLYAYEEKEDGCWTTCFHMQRWPPRA